MAYKSFILISYVCSKDQTEDKAKSEDLRKKQNQKEERKKSEI